MEKELEKEMLELKTSTIIELDKIKTAAEYARRDALYALEGDGEETVKALERIANALAIIKGLAEGLEPKLVV